MSDNNFNGDFDGDFVNGDKTVYNQQPQTLWDLSTKDLKNELARCSYKKSEINKKYILPLLLMLLSLGTVFISLNFKLSFEFFLIIVVFGMGFPALWFAHIEKSYKSASIFYQTRINNIKLILQDRM